MPQLFDRSAIKSMKLKNRIVRSATFERMCDKDGFPLAELGALYENLAQGNVGLIITGFASVSGDVKAPYTSRIDEDCLIPKFKTIIDKVHEHDCAIAMQINHPGRQTTKEIIGHNPVAPSAINNKFPPSHPKELSEEHIQAIITDFIDAASRVKKAGFDAVQIQAGHGMLINQFLCPHTNRRKDRWGGPLEYRMRFLEEIYRGCRATLGDHYPILAKLSVYDNMKHGIKLKEGIAIAQKAAEIGFDGLEISCGIFEDGLSSFRGDFPVEILLDDYHSFDGNPPLRFLMRRFGKKLMRVPDFTKGFNRHAAKAIKQKVKVPIFTLGGIHDPMDMMEVIEKGEADYVSLCRPLIAEPDLPLKISQGNLNPSKCLHCNHCFFYTVMKEPLKCYYGKRIGAMAMQK
jgi:2,4-dienoyl-CoA reductase-like NADH-dependent reductase (Old Yellow Enzyme family)